MGTEAITTSDSVFFFFLTHRRNLLECGEMGRVKECQKPESHLDDMKMLQAAYRLYTIFLCRHENELTFDVKRGQIALRAIDVEGESIQENKDRWPHGCRSIWSHWFFFGCRAEVLTVAISSGPKQKQISKFIRVVEIFLYYVEVGSHHLGEETVGFHSVHTHWSVLGNAGDSSQSMQLFSFKVKVQTDTIQLHHFTQMQ